MREGTKRILKLAGLKNHVEAIEHGFCPCCRKPVTGEFRNEKSKREFGISGMCQDCQDGVFGKD